MIEKRKIPSKPYEMPVAKEESPYSPEQLIEMSERVKYEGDPRHKKKRGNFVLQANVRHNPKKSLCDKVGIFDRQQVLDLLKDGINKELISLPDIRDYDFP